VTRRIVLDTDMGSDVDDALCLALALASPELEIAAITTIGNEARLRARITAKLLALAGASEIPVHAGCRVPLCGGDGFNWFGHEGESLLEPTEEPPISSEHAVDALRRILRAEPGLELVFVGPLTNLAAALVLEPELAARVGGLTVMGGHVREARYGGKVFAPGVDYNLCSDPHASSVVLRAGIPTRLVTADVTLATWITAADVAQLEAVGTPFHLALAAQIRIWTSVQKRIFGSAGCDVDDDNVAFLHDPLALACVHDESFCRFETLEIEPRIEGRVLRTLEHPAPAPGSHPMRCALDVDAKRFRAHFMERVLGLAPRAQ
jgi:purine nucleosidase